MARGSSELRRLTGHGGYDHERSRFDELTGVFGMDMTLFFFQKKKKTRELQKGGNTKIQRIGEAMYLFFTLVKVGAGTKRWWIFLHGWESMNLGVMNSRK